MGSLLKLMRCRIIAENVHTIDKGKKCRVMVMGPQGVGKTSLIKRFIHDELPSHYEPTVEDSYNTRTEVGNTLVDLMIVDTSGTFSFPAMRRLNIIKADVIMVVFSLTDITSFEQIPECIAEVRSAPGGREKKIIVVGTGCEEMAGKREIDKVLADAIVCIDWGLQYIETSSMQNINVESAFLLAACKR